MGVDSPAIDAEAILLAVTILKELGLKDLHLKINNDCKSRFERNPLRLLDCKVPHDHELAAGAPSLEECLCDECREHFEGVKRLLTAAGVDFEVDNTLVRGLDYYTKTAFEIQYVPLGAQSAVCGGGRYDGLVKEIGGQDVSGIGFAMGMERILLALESQNLLPEHKDGIDAFIVCPNLPQSG